MGRRTDMLSHQEHLVCGLRAGGATGRQVAEWLGIGYDTQGRYLQRARKKYRERGHRVGNIIELGMAMAFDFPPGIALVAIGPYQARKMAGL